jgi:hypothetical protein
MFEEIVTPSAVTGGITVRQDQESENANRESLAQDSETDQPEVNDKATPRGHHVAARGRNVRRAITTRLQELQKLLSPLCPSTVDGQEHRLIRMLQELDVMEIAPEENELREIVVGMLRKIGNSLISSADCLESRTKLAEAA